MEKASGWEIYTLFFLTFSNEKRTEQCFLNKSFKKNVNGKLIDKCRLFSKFLLTDYIYSLHPVVSCIFLYI